MSFLLDHTFTVTEWLAITGFAQSILIIVYIAFRVRSWQQASLALTYFLVLAVMFALQFALRLEDYEQPLRLMLWICRALGPLLCYLLVLQVVKGALPGGRQFWVLALMPFALLAAFLMRDVIYTCDIGSLLCPGFFLWLHWFGAIAGAIALLALWVHKNLFSQLRKAKSGMERYWLVLVLIVANIGAVCVGFLGSVGSLQESETDALLMVLGLAFIYLATTTLFRVYPSPVELNAEPTRFTTQVMTPEEKELAAKIRTLMEVDKLYHEPAFSRADLARELNISENILSRVINVAFGKSFPRLLNEFRVDDAKRMLQAPEIPIQVVASEVGFNSLASFNRAFREITHLTPSQYKVTIQSGDKP
jgi:AraC-like DNA-binding protein